MQMISIHDCKEELKNINLKATPARLAVLNILEKSDTPLDISHIFSLLNKKGLKTDFATIFRTMNSFTEKGLTKQINLNEGKARYEISRNDNHHHLICQNCVSIEDISDCPIDALEKEIQEKKKFIIKTHSLEFFGLCKNCQS